MSAVKKEKNNIIDFENALKEKRNNRYFYKVANHHELYKVGQSFYEDFQKGIKSFAITSTGYGMGQQVSILGVASFFDHKKDMKIGIVSKNLTLGVFGEVAEESTSRSLQIEGERIDTLSFHDHFDLIEMDNLLNIVNDEKTRGYDKLIDSLIANYDIIFWDVPDIEDLASNSEQYFPMIMKFEKLSIVVAKNVSSSKKLDDIQDFFNGYGISLKGLLIKEEEKEPQEELSIFEKVIGWLK